MARRKLKKKRKVDRLFRRALTLFIFAIVLTIGSRLFIRQENIALTIQIQSTQREISLIEEENKQLEMDIQTLSSKERIYEIAKANGLEKNDNVQNVVKSEEKEVMNND